MVTSRLEADDQPRKNGADRQARHEHPAQAQDDGDRGQSGQPLRRLSRRRARPPVSRTGTVALPALRRRITRRRFVSTADVLIDDSLAPRTVFRR
jgi:hypothetical protein